MSRHFVGFTRRGRVALVAFGVAMALLLGFSASASAGDIACHESEKPAVKTPKAPSREAVAAALARVRVIDAPMALCPAVDEPAEAGGLVAAVDPTTGELRQATAEEMRALRPRDESRFQKKAVTSAEPILLPSGAVVMELGEEHLNDVVVGVGADGTIVYSCTTAARASELQPAAAKTREEK